MQEKNDTAPPENETLVDGKQYRKFMVMQFPRGAYFRFEFVAYSEDEEKLMLPITIKNLYQTKEAANDVMHIVAQLFMGKNREQCEEMLGVRFTEGEQQ